MDKTQIQVVVRDLGGPRKLARDLSAVGEPVTHAAICQWSRIPPERCPEIEAVSGGKYRCEALRPDLEWDRRRGRVVSYRVPVGSAATRKAAA